MAHICVHLDTQQGVGAGRAVHFGFHGQSLKPTRIDTTAAASRHIAQRPILFHGLTTRWTLDGVEKQKIAV